MSKVIVISAIALRSGGTLSILQDCLRELSRAEYRSMKIHVLVKDRRLVEDPGSNFDFIELDGTRSYFRRCYYEYFYFKRLSRQLKPDLWFSLHDMSPRVEAARQAVYCHNASPFYSISLREFMQDPKFGLFTWLYGILYRINIKSNTWIVVQQSWLRQKFAKRFALAERTIIVAHPSTRHRPAGDLVTKPARPVFFYPLLARVFKNVEVIGEAVRLLNARDINDFDVVVTLDGTENRYAAGLLKRYGDLAPFQWIGQVSRDRVFEIYGTCSYLIFPSRLETWGLPISEFKETGKPMLLADLPYARESAGDYGQLIFFNPDSAQELAVEMEKLILGQPVQFAFNPLPDAVSPKADNWSELFKIMLAF